MPGDGGPGQTRTLRSTDTGPGVSPARTSRSSPTRDRSWTPAARRRTLSRPRRPAPAAAWACRAAARRAAHAPLRPARQPPAWPRPDGQQPARPHARRRPAVRPAARPHAERPDAGQRPSGLRPLGRSPSRRTLGRSAALGRPGRSGRTFGGRPRLDVVDDRGRANPGVRGDPAQGQVHHRADLEHRSRDDRPRGRRCDGSGREGTGAPYRRQRLKRDLRSPRGDCGRSNHHEDDECCQRKAGDGEDRAKDGGTGQRDTPDPGKLDSRDRGKPLARHGRRAVPVRTITRSRYVTPGGLPTLVRRTGTVMRVTEPTRLAIGATSDRPDSPVIDRYSIVLGCDDAGGRAVRNATQLVHRSRTAPGPRPFDALSEPLNRRHCEPERTSDAGYG